MNIGFYMGLLIIIISLVAIIVFKNKSTTGLIIRIIGGIIAFLYFLYLVYFKLNIF